MGGCPPLSPHVQDSAARCVRGADGPEISTFMPTDSLANSTSQLTRVGWSPFFQRQLDELGTPLRPARVAAGRRGHYELLSERGPIEATLTGRFHYEAAEHKDLPVVGDWVGTLPREGGTAFAIVHLFARRSQLVRKAAGRQTTAQIMAANLDTVMIVTSLNGDFNLRRLERYLAAIHESGARPVLVLNKTDLCDEPSRFVDAARSIAPDLPILPASALSGDGVDTLRAHLREGETLALVGSSGVGKSALVNRLLGEPTQSVRAVRAHDDRGRHTTTHRELFVLPSGGMLIDTPGIRELQLWASEGETSSSFEDIEALAAACRFRDCMHDGEPGCNVEDAIAKGALDPGRLDNMRKLDREQKHQREKQDALARLNTKRQGKAIHQQMRTHPKR